MRARVAIVVVVAAAVGLTWAAPARACTAPCPAVSRPRGPRVLHVPTAWVQPRDVAFGSAGVDHRGGAFFDLVGSLGGLAEVELVASDALAACDPCDDARRGAHAWIGEAGFKLGVGEGVLLRGQPALAIGLRRSFAGRVSGDAGAQPRIAALYAVASVDVHGLRLHGGVASWAAAVHGAPMTQLATTPRPFAGLEWTPGRYPRTTVLGDVSTTAELGARPALRWLGGWGVRYQALAWASIELAVRHREDEGLGGATVMIRLNGVLAGQSGYPARPGR